MINIWLETGILILVSLSAWWGWKRGLERETGALAGLVFASVAALGAWSSIAANLPEYSTLQRLAALIAGSGAAFVVGYVATRIVVSVLAHIAKVFIPSVAQWLGRPLALLMGVGRGFVLAALLHFLTTGLSLERKPDALAYGPLGLITLVAGQALNALTPWQDTAPRNPL